MPSGSGRFSGWYVRDVFSRKSAQIGLAPKIQAMPNDLFDKSLQSAYIEFSTIQLSANIIHHPCKDSLYNLDENF